uniref:Uncharacterized protein n=1 Tax=Anguilla anguilla TaxID=7936 RepID=A0A0E9RFA7_ANGAN
MDHTPAVMHSLKNSIYPLACGQNLKANHLFKVNR